jgi:lipopolysaccharide biosynthesis regulator YciM
MYQQARELARSGEFDRAEQMLRDLAEVDTEDGKSARTHLEFDFYMEKAKWLLVRQRFEEARAVGEYLLAQDLNRFQRDQAEKILDYTGHIDAAMSMVESQEVAGACKQLIVLFASQYADNGYYPPTFSLADLEKFDAYTARSIGRNINSIERYTATQDHYTLVALGRDGKRYTIEDGELK